MVEPPGRKGPVQHRGRGEASSTPIHGAGANGDVTARGLFAAVLMHAEKDAERGQQRMIRQRMTCMGTRQPRTKRVKQQQHSRCVVPGHIGRMVSVIKTVGGA